MKLRVRPSQVYKAKMYLQSVNRKMTPSVGNAENDTEDVMEGQVLNPESQRGLTLCC